MHSYQGPFQQLDQWSNPQIIGKIKIPEDVVRYISYINMYYHFRLQYIRIIRYNIYIEISCNYVITCH